MWFPTPRPITTTPGSIPARTTLTIRTMGIIRTVMAGLRFPSRLVLAVITAVVIITMAAIMAAGTTAGGTVVAAAGITEILNP